MKRIIVLVLSFVMCLSMVSCGAKDVISDVGITNKSNEKVEEFYEKVSESQQLLDTVADDIYDYWYDCIYEDKYGEDISTAVLMAQVENADNLEKIETLDGEISTLFKEAKDSDQGDLVKEVMSAYSDYYEFVVNVSGSFESYKSNKETLKKELASLLRDLSYEL